MRDARQGLDGKSLLSINRGLIPPD